ncbi:hypothetical protein ABZV80_33815 [Streptomyces sp. NPDC005132]|uniref:hypothetical protein n=1 Tax=Streptomyces sp. NPDC005132 TaxID=3154294 RepID=UPI0033B6B62F
MAVQPTLAGYHTVFTVLGVVCVAAAALAVGRTRTGRHGRNNLPGPLSKTGVATPRTPLAHNAPSR